MEKINNQIIWGNPIFRKNLRDHEESNLVALNNSLKEVYIVEGEEDKRYWSISSNGVFSVYSLF